MSNFEEAMREDLRDIRKDIHELRHELTKYKGFLGGVMWAAAALVAVVQVALNWIKGV